MLFSFLCAITHTLKSQNNYQYDALGRLISDLSEGIVKIEWNNLNKVTYIVHADTSHRPDVLFAYDAMGYKDMKLVKPRNGKGLMPQSTWRYTYYVYDAGGKLMTVYQRNFIQDEANENSFTDKIQIDEQHIYSTTHIGYSAPQTSALAELQFTTFIDSNGGFSDRQNGDVRMASPFYNNIATNRSRKFYQLDGNHGSVLTLVSDRTCAVNGPGHSYSEIISASDYYPFGMILPERTFNDSSLRYGFSGKEKLSEIKRKDNTYDFGARLYDPRLGRWLSIDPLQSKYASYSTYNFALNSPIMFSDPDGNVVVDSKGNPIGIDMHQEANKWSVKFKFGNNTSKREQQQIRNSIERGLSTLAQTESGRTQIERLKTSKRAMQFIFGEDPILPKARVSFRRDSDDKMARFDITVNETNFKKSLNVIKSKISELDAVTKLLKTANTEERIKTLEERRKKLYDEIMHAPAVSGMDIDTQREFLSMSYDKKLAAFLSGVIELAVDDAAGVNYFKYYKEGEVGTTTKEKIAYEMPKLMLSKEMIRQFRDLQKLNK